jgi:hypothetical protein
MLAYIYLVKILTRDFAVQVCMVNTYSPYIGEAAIVSSLGFRLYSPVDFIVCIGFAFYCDTAKPRHFARRRVSR